MTLANSSSDLVTVRREVLDVFSTRLDEAVYFCTDIHELKKLCRETASALSALHAGDGVQAETPLTKQESSGADRSESEFCIRYDFIYEYADKHRLNYNELCLLVRSSVLSAPPPVSVHAVGKAVRMALNEVITNGEWTEGEQRGEWKISKEVYDTAVDALAGSTPDAGNLTGGDRE